MSIERIGVESKQELEQMVTKEIDQIEKGLNVVCNNVQLNDKTSLDVLCHDDNGQIVVLQLNVNEDDEMLMQGIQSLDYVDKFKSFLKATYSKHKINDKEKPRLILVAPSFSETLRHVVQYMQGIRVDLYEWEYLKIGDHKGLRLQSIFAWKPSEKREEKAETKPTEKKREKKSEKKSEKTPEEEKEISEETEEPKVEPPKDEFPIFPPPQEETKEEETEPERKKEPPRRKLRLF